MKDSVDEVDIQIILKSYFENYFDETEIWKVIPKHNLPFREFGFERIDKGFTRNKSFKEISHLKEYLFTFPVSGAYIGSVYKDRLLQGNRENKPITIHNSEWMGRELLFDLDMDDYQNVRTCDCQGRNVCEICWTLMQDAAEIITDTLEVDFGFKELIWVYTGGRGYHCWVLDANAFTMDQEQRAALIGYMQLIQDPKGNERIDSLGNSSKLLKERIYKKLARNFILNEKNTILQNECGYSKNMLDKARITLDKSNLIQDLMRSIPKDESQFLNALIKRRYPRIDHKVSIDTRRLIRMPESVHIKTKNICKIIKDPVSFNPLNDAINLNTIFSM
ncbi:MAG: DNA primase catalytic subunit PriS [Candidatus Heimdallarchaeota archaeon]|nr:DNA primase catalytic subunit PriS [Candidatus Heimdallarchaeota archaeon]MDH5646043.1 DNA primase catalytic subunit PriS [Candidatus Heimdallarchaeota archaeon]